MSRPNADAHYAAGMKARAENDMEKARVEFAIACSIEPLDDACSYQLGACYADMGRPEEGLYYLNHAFHLNPRNHHAGTVLGAVLSVLGRTQQSKDVLDRVITMAPHMPSAHWNRAGVNLALGNFTQGWSDYEYGFCNGKRTSRFPAQKWDGKAKGRVLFTAEQGIGDAIQFARFVKEAGAEYSILEVRPELYKLMHLSAVADRVSINHGDGATSEEFDYYYPIMSLPHLLGIEYSDVKGAPYLRNPLGKTYVLEGQKKIGYVYKGNPQFGNDRNRSIHNPAYLEPLLSADVSLYNMQKGDDGSVANDCSDWADTADCLMRIDALVTVDTGIAHLAGALGVRTLLMVPYVCDWRWGNPQKPTCKVNWYDSVEIYRQPKPRDWHSVIKQVVEAL